jgi:hypothetical protein
MTRSEMVSLCFDREIPEETIGYRDAEERQTKLHPALAINRIIASEKPRSAGRMIAIAV